MANFPPSGERRQRSESPLLCEGEIKAVVDMVGIAGKEGSIQTPRAASVCI